VYAFAIYGQGIDVIDVSDKLNPQLITNFNYPGSGVHNGAISGDGRYIFIGDEIGSSGNHTRGFDISDIMNVSLASQIIVNPPAIAHNCYIRGDLIFIAHYTEGVRVWDISDPVAPFEVAHYDTYQPAGIGYFGNWTAYPLLPSGKIIASDLQTGLWVFTMADADGDGIFDVTDNCPGSPNPGQEDSDGDNVGDACEACFCQCQADPECEGTISDVIDVVNTVNVAFRGLPALNDPYANCPYQRTDFDCNAFTDVIDVVKVVNVAFRGAPAATEYCIPCP
jgi:hypothetical protein